jgi:hypothetical protein
MVEDLGLGKHPVRIEHEVPQKLEFRGGEFNNGSTPTDLVRVVVELQVVYPDDRVVVDQWLGAPQHGPDAGHHLVQAERLSHVVIAANGQPCHLVFRIVLGSQEEDREVLARGPKAPRDSEAVHIGEHDVEDGEIRRMEVGCSQGVPSVPGRDHFEACESKRGGQQLTNVRFVVDNKELGFGPILFHTSHNAPSVWEFSG